MVEIYIYGYQLSFIKFILYISHSAKCTQSKHIKLPWVEIIDKLSYFRH